MWKKLLFVFSVLSGGPIFILSSTSASKENPLNVLLCSGFGGASHAKPILEYGVQLKERGHLVTATVLKEQESLVKKYGFNYVLSTQEVVDVESIRDSQKMMQGEYQLGANIEFALPALEHFYDAMYKGLKPWFEEKNKQGKLPNVIVADFAAVSCFVLADEYNVTAINSAPLLGGPAGHTPSNVNLKVFFEPTSLADLSLSQRLQRKFFDYLLVIPTVGLSNLRRMYELLSHCQNRVLLGNTFFPFTPSGIYPSFFKAVGPVVPTVYESLSEKLKEQLDDLQNKNQRAALVAFGSNVQLTETTAGNLLQGLKDSLDKGLIHKVYWSIGKSNQNLFKTVKDKRFEFLHWVPQFALLQHPAVQLFVSHGGAESSHEAILAGKPVVGIPVFGDQPGNAYRLQELGLGRSFHKSKFNPSDIVEALKDIFVDRKEYYQKQNKMFQDIAQRASVSGMEEAVDTIEAVGYFGDNYLFPDDRNMSWIKENNYDIIGLCLALVGFILYFLVKIFMFIKNCLKQKAPVSKKKKTN